MTMIKLDFDQAVQIEFFPELKAILLSLLVLEKLSLLISLVDLLLNCPMLI